MTASITTTELMAAYAAKTITFHEYLRMLKILRQMEPRPDCVDWMAEEGDH